MREDSARRLTTVVLASASRHATAVLDVLRDWSAAGLLEDFLWVRALDVSLDGGPTRVPARRASRGRLQSGDLFDLLGDMPDADGTRIVVLSSLATPGGVVDPKRATRLRASLPSAPRPGSAVHCLLMRYGGDANTVSGWDPSAVWLGWHNLVLSPEDGRSPDPQSPPIVLDGSDESAFVVHAAAGLAAVGGLWAHLPVGPLDDEVPGRSGPEVRVVRQFTRRLDTAEVAARLEAVLTDRSAGWPRPYGSFGRLKPVNDSQAACGQMATQVMDRYPQLLTSPGRIRSVATAVQEPDRQVTSPGFGRWLRAVLTGRTKIWTSWGRETPAVTAGWLVALRQELARTPALQRAIDVAGSEYDLQAVAHDVAEMAGWAARWSPGAPDVSVAPAPATFWKDFVRGALALSDGGVHGEMQPPTGADGSARFVRTAAEVAPPPDSRFELPAHLAAQLGISAVQAGDIRTATLAQQHLRALAASGPYEGGGAGRTAEDLRVWREAASRTYVGQVGDRLHRALDEALRGVDRLVTIAGTSWQSAGVASRPVPRAFRWLRWSLVGWLVVTLGLGLAAWKGPVAPRVAVALPVVGLLAWAAAAVQTWRRHRPEPPARGGDVQHLSVQQLTDSLATLRSRVQLYAQYLAWSAVLGTFLQNPFGTCTREQDPAVAVGAPLPRSVGLAEAVPSEAQLQQQAQELGVQLFQTGWLEELWNDVLGSSPDRLGRVGRDLDTAEMLFEDAALSPESALHLLAGLCQQDGVGPVARQRFLTRVTARLLDPGAGSLSALTEQVRSLPRQAAPPSRGMSGADLIDDLISSVHVVSYFRPELFTSEVVVNGGTRVTENVLVTTIANSPVAASADAPNRWVHVAPSAQVGLDRLLVAIQLSRRFSPHDLRSVLPAVTEPEPVVVLEITDPTTPRSRDYF